MGRKAETSVPLTIRLPYDVYREVAARSRSREWSMSHYVTHCVRRELGSAKRARPTRVANHNLELVSDADEQ
jgi:hypothetical protein